MGWVSDNVRKTRVTRAISAFFRAHLHIAKKSTGCWRKMAKQVPVSRKKSEKRTTGSAEGGFDTDMVPVET